MTKTTKYIIAGIVGILVIASIAGFIISDSNDNSEENNTTESSVMDSQANKSDKEKMNEVSIDNQEDSLDDEWTGLISIEPKNKNSFDFSVCEDNQPGSGTHNYQKSVDPMLSDNTVLTFYIDDLNLLEGRPTKVVNAVSQLHRIVSDTQSSELSIDRDLILYSFDCNGTGFDNVVESDLFSLENLKNDITGYYDNGSYYYAEGSSIIGIFVVKINDEQVLTFDEFQRIVVNELEL